jgi:hypothetical protein
MLDSEIEERWCAQPWAVLMHAFIQRAMLKSWMERREVSLRFFLEYVKLRSHHCNTHDIIIAPKRIKDESSCVYSETIDE